MHPAVRDRPAADAGPDMRRAAAEIPPWPSQLPPSYVAATPRAECVADSTSPPHATAVEPVPRADDRRPGNWSRASSVSVMKRDPIDHDAPHRPVSRMQERFERAAIGQISPVAHRSASRPRHPRCVRPTLEPRPGDSGDTGTVHPTGAPTSSVVVISTWHGIPVGGSQASAPAFEKTLS